MLYAFYLEISSSWGYDLPEETSSLPTNPFIAYLTKPILPCDPRPASSAHLVAVHAAKTFSERRPGHVSRTSLRPITLTTTTTYRLQLLMRQP